ncbi:MarR family transcriptional regulator [Halosimplex aquaticum]|uniref:MarR family transcriptional regulator n=1 Tax=Halosimplex aquaticum TaxID=3026162 RepID=A0ABD5XZB7_9EURY|nr:MarR family transcriptional regulator [Halosimplex aquaticum]
MRAIEPAWHEYAANLLFVEDGLMPYFAADSQVKAGGGSQQARFELAGESWNVKLYYQDSGIVHPGPSTPTGTDFRLDEIREFRLHVARASDEDPVGEQSFNAHIAPRWQGMQVESDDGQRFEMDVPEEMDEGINVRIQGSNINALRYSTLLKRAAEAVGISMGYFENPLEFSNTQDAERYVRVHKNESGPVHARDGPVATMGHLLEDDRTGYRKVVQNDDDEHGRNLPGYYHTVTLGPQRVREAFPSHELPVEVKHYYSREALARDPDDPLAHPKVGVSYQVSRWDDTLGADQEALAQLQRELDRVLHAVLIDAGLDVAPDHGSGPFVEDAYFDAEVSDGFEEPPTLDMAHIHHEQESVVLKHVKDGLSPVEWESLEVLVTDGGEVAPADIAEEKGRHVDSVRDALRRMDDLVQREYGSVSLRSTYVAELVHDAVQRAEDAVRDAASASAKALEAAERGLDERTSALLAFCDRYNIDYRDKGDARMKIRFGELDPDADPSPAFLAKRAFGLWTDAKQDAERFRSALVKWSRPDGERCRVDAWRLLA